MNFVKTLFVCLSVLMLSACSQADNESTFFSIYAKVVELNDSSMRLELGSVNRDLQRPKKEDQKEDKPLDEIETNDVELSKITDNGYDFISNGEIITINYEKSDICLEEGELLELEVDNIVSILYTVDVNSNPILLSISILNNQTDN